MAAYLGNRWWTECGKLAWPSKKECTHTASQCWGGCVFSIRSHGRGAPSWSSKLLCSTKYQKLSQVQSPHGGNHGCQGQRQGAATRQQRTATPGVPNQPTRSPPSSPMLSVLVKLDPPGSTHWPTFLPFDSSFLGFLAFALSHLPTHMHELLFQQSHTETSHCYVSVPN